MRERTYLGLIGVAVAHLGLVAMGAGYVDFDRLGVIGRALDYYGEVSGSGHSYGFFAPGVGSEVRARFEVTSADGSSREVSILTGASHEANLRIGNIIDQFRHLDEVDEDEETDVRRSLAASLAGAVFGRNPDATNVEVHLDEFEPVSSAEYVNGDRAEWREIYLAKFQHETRNTAEVIDQ